MVDVLVYVPGCKVCVRPQVLHILWLDKREVSLGIVNPVVERCGGYQGVESGVQGTNCRGSLRSLRFDIMAFVHSANIHLAAYIALPLRVRYEAGCFSLSSRPAPLNTPVCQGRSTMSDGQGPFGCDNDITVIVRIAVENLIPFCESSV